MTTFNAQKHKEQNQDHGVPPGEYLLAITWLELRESKKGKSYAKDRVTIIAGAAKGKKFYDMIGLDVSNAGTAARLSILLEQCGHEGDIDLDDEESLKKAFLNRPFKAKVRREQKDGYTNNSIERFITGDKVTDRDREAMDAWVLERAAASDFEGGGSEEGGDFTDDVPPPSDDDYSPSRGRGRGDDDIPF